MQYTLSRVKRKLLEQNLVRTMHRYYQRHFVRAQTYPIQNIYHCCTQKTASQWFKSLFTDDMFYRATGLQTYTFAEWRTQMRQQDPDMQTSQLYDEYTTTVPFPLTTVGTNLYIGYETYRALPKPAQSRGFFILRDPRDIVVSWYFSMLYSHDPSGNVPVYRTELKEREQEDGFKYAIRTLNDTRLFAGQRSWAVASQHDSSIRVLRYEDFVRDNLAFLHELFAFLDVPFTDQEVQTICTNHEFSSYARGRSAGEENIHSHMRKGIAGDWQNYFTDDVHAYFDEITGDLLDVLGYSTTVAG